MLLALVTSPANKSWWRCSRATEAVDGLTLVGPPWSTPSTPQESSWRKGDSISQGWIPWCEGVGQGGSPWCKGDGTSQGESFGAEAYRGGSGWGNLQIWVASSWFLCYTVGSVGAPGKTGVGNRSFSQASHLLFVGTSHLSVLLVTQLQGNGSKKTAMKKIEDPMTTYLLLW